MPRFSRSHIPMRFSSGSVSGAGIGWKPENSFMNTDETRIPRGLVRRTVEMISGEKNEPAWMREFRLRAFDIFESKAMPAWGADLSGIRFDDFWYFIRSARQSRDWSDVPDEIHSTFERLGIPQAERAFLAGVSAQYESEVVYHRLKDEWAAKGIIFCDTDTALREHPELVRDYFGTMVPAADNKFAALNSAVWSGGSFVYVPKGVKADIPLQAYFRINAKNMGQFERTLIIADEGSEVSYIEGCTAPRYSEAALHSAVVEIVAKPHSRVRYTTVQNWSKNVYNLVTKRAFAEEDAVVEWIDGNLGSKATMKYPSVFLRGRGARADILSIAYAGEGQHQDAGGKVFHLAPDTRSRIISKSVSAAGGRASYRGMVKVIAGAENAKCKVSCEAMMVGERARADTYPVIRVAEPTASVEHEASATRVSEEQMRYLESRGLREADAMGLLVAGFLEPLAKELPLEYAAEFNELMRLEMEKSIA
ncbi:MAG: Fe-S cluster assembly protein SufB [Candidatus Niyogibacteria bacterium]|nr:Fe-S cluster assembly protein SufB [Candidatus Niyogibacteria bacterium]